MMTNQSPDQKDQKIAELEAQLSVLNKERGILLEIMVTASTILNGQNSVFNRALQPWFDLTKAQAEGRTPATYWAVISENGFFIEQSPRTNLPDSIDNPQLKSSIHNLAWHEARKLHEVKYGPLSNEG